ncbi:FHA domain-containing protein [Frondihabitans australicus]|uniref:FHA domain-containing protein n=1 Tax=Frondihabitans australicus TaxID=386892 RepID=A0A495IDT6_9MICO|nr:FHA domain-containing protein [Frondihabitans australicus]RKR73810.1 FHA domain-containing protein [Frondihabitans australicus]
MTTSSPARFHSVRIGAATFALDAPLIVGRRPSPPRIVRGAVPRLAAVPSARGEVSATHVDIRQEGTAVVVTDMRSTNGTRVVIPGRLPVALRQGESIVVLAGTIVDIGDGNHLEILPLNRLVPQEESAL